ncbi:MAG TPA: PVC-type heme-binding CxxCH protein [Gemmataceae bacterium]|jgi:putative membrane-bound dehydrogenase-like protein
MNRWPIALCLLLVLFVPAVHAQLPPEKAAATFTVADGLEMALWASEPLFVNPTCIDIDHKGRVWVCESVNYRNKLHGKKKLNRPEGDRIVILEDSKGTGKADKATTFYQSPELLAPLGIAVAKEPVGPGYKVYVCQSPDILVFEDKDGDGKADGPPKKLLTGFGGYDHDHGVHGILIGPDGKLYFSVGDTGVHGLQSADGKGRKWQSNSTDCRAGTIWRCDLDGKNLELLAHNFRNEYEPCVDSFGTVFVSDNDDDGNQQTRICYVMPGGNYGYHPRGPGQSHWHEEQPGVVPKILRTGFGSPTGICVYEGTLLPKKYWGQLLHTDAGPRHVRCYHLTTKGAGYDVEREDMVTSTDNWFRPSDICVAPDGSVFVSDWYDPGVGGHGMGDTTRGRIYRLAPKGNKYSVPKVDLESKDGITTALASPNLAVRYMAMAKMRAMPKRDAKILLKAAGRQMENPWLRARAVWQLKALDELYTGSKEPWGLAMNDSDDRFRELAWRVREDELAPLVSEKGDPLIGILLDQPTTIRRDVLLAMRDAKVDDSIRKLILELVKQYDGKDRFYLEAIGIAVGHDPKRREIILADFAKQFPEWNDKVAGLVWELRPPAMLPVLEKRLVDAKVPAAQRAQIVDILAASEDKEAGAALLKVLQADVPAEVRDKVLDNLKRFLPGKWRELRRSAELTGAVERLIKTPDRRPAGLALIAAAERVDQVACVTTHLIDEKEPAAIRRQAVVTLGKLPSGEAVSALQAFVNNHPSSPLAGDAVAALGVQAGARDKRPTNAAALKALQEMLRDKRAGGEVNRASLVALAGTRQGTIWLLDSHAKKELPADLVADAGPLLRNSPYVDLRNRALIAFPPPGRIDPKKLPSIAKLLARKGDAARGQKQIAASIKNDMQCLKCHSIRGSGGQIGPDLSVIGKKASKENLFESIVLPSKAIADQYLNWQIETKKGLSLSGLLIEETPTAITLRDANGKDTKIDKKDIETREKSPKSLMPDDLLVYMTEDDLVDIVAYLFEQKTPALGMDWWHIIGPFDNGAADAGFDKVYPPEKDVDPKASYEGKSGNVRWKTVKADAKGYVDLQAFFAPASSQIVSYLYRDIESPADQEATILLGADDCARLWVNGQVVHTSRDHNAAAPEQYTVKVKLKKGVNRILLKINNGEGPHGFYFTLLAEQELKRLAAK